MNALFFFISSSIPSIIHLDYCHFISIELYKRQKYTMQLKRNDILSVLFQKSSSHFYFETKIFLKSIYAIY